MQIELKSCPTYKTYEKEFAKSFNDLVNRYKYEVNSHLTRYSFEQELWDLITYYFPNEKDNFDFGTSSNDDVLNIIPYNSFTKDKFSCLND